MRGRSRSDAARQGAERNQGKVFGGGLSGCVGFVKYCDGHHIVVPLVSALLGALLPLLRLLVEELSKRYKLDEFFQGDLGKLILDTLGLNTSKDKAETLFKELGETSAKMDGIVARIQQYTTGRQQAVEKLEAQLSALTQEETTMRQNIEALKQVPLPAAQYFADVITKGEKSSAFRDYMLFASGVVVSVVVAIVLKHFNLA